MSKPWEVRQDPRDPNAWDVYEGKSKIAHLPWCSRGNAHLIAAAPELLEALLAVHARRIAWPAEVEFLVMAAIAKAEGK